jgi:acyl carrier protein
MTSADTLQKVQEAFQKIFRNLEFSRELSQATTSEWTSLRHVQLLGALERRFGIEFSPEEVSKLTSIEAILSRLDGSL